MKLNEIIQEQGTSPDKLINILMEYQKTKDTKVLTTEDLKIVAQELGVTEALVYQVATFYTLLSTKERGAHIIQVCEDIPCYVNGCVNVVTELEKKLKIKMGETTYDKMFTLEHTSCLGCCNIAPAMRVDGKLIGNLTPEKISDIIDEIRGEKNER